MGSKAQQKPMLLVFRAQQKHVLLILRAQQKHALLTIFLLTVHLTVLDRPGVAGAVPQTALS